MSEWRPIQPVAEGELLPCGGDPSGAIREFFANAADVPELLEDGIRVRIDGRLERFRVVLTSTPLYGNGDVQVRAVAA